VDGAVPYLGETLALVTAVTWAFAVILFRKSGETVHPVFLNLFKNLLAIALFLPTMWILGETLTRHAPATDYLLLLLSGALGIGIGDAMFFKSLNEIGAGLWSIVACLYSPFIIVLSVILLGERLTVPQILGAVMIISAVLSTIQRKSSTSRVRRDLVSGIIWGVLATAATAVGIVMIKPLLERSPILWVTEVRLFGGVAVLVLITLFHPSRRRILFSNFSPSAWGYTVAGSLLGAYLAMFFWLAGMKFTQASVAAVLNQTSNMFVFVFAAIFLREPITRQRTIAIVLAISGAFLVYFG
jgi:drug/metabolite transporter (DMT)-like permease